MRTVVLLGIMVLCCTSCYGEKAMNTPRIRRSAVAGSWYPGSKTALQKEVQHYLDKVDTILTGKTVRAMIVPHAGYVYSGRCAAYSFKQLENQKVDRVFLMGPSHRVPFKGISIPDVDAYETPLGLVPLDADMIKKLRKEPLITEVAQAHISEHSLELELPFLQTVAGDFTLIPMLVGNITAEEARKVGGQIAALMGPNDILVASTDFTHYGPMFGFAPFRKDVKENITKLDMGAVDLILKRDIPGMYEYSRRTGITWDGVTATPVMLAALPQNVKGEKLLYYKSGDAENDYSHSVSYVSLVFYEEKTPVPAEKKEKKPVEKEMTLENKQEENILTHEEKQTLLKIARDTLTSHVQGKGKPDLNKYTLTAQLKEKAGAFVTLHKHGQLRGCIGYIEGIKPLAETVRENACNASTEDPRFPPVKQDELKDIDIEVSVMSPLRKIDSPKEVITGKHGVVLKKGWNQGVFLPQVATEQGWDRETFLQYLGRKAGLDTEAYKTADLFVFTAEVFGEKKD